MALAVILCAISVSYIGERGFYKNLFCMATKGIKTDLLRRWYDKAIDMILRKETVGFDKMGNKYFRYWENNRGERVERREVKWATLYINYEPDQVPSEWRMWLRKQRDAPPTDAEMAASEEKAEAMRGRIERIEEQDALRRKRQAAENSQPAMENMFKRIQSKD